ncbi:DUF3099 domain-containing protein [Actinopolymorpha pittospori]|jgi:hypothetical protein|uniref:Flp pilus assembly protein TadB n=1 Tax=Actinopolymorpha pittospori TaxID=648752 RepID=A0A927RDH2_9ACTN|nr:DUF3099 domain-containing protein [Actinopolymorpha pittospori]MBE1611029.1 Flp pilus assembly protein TadB [Actinopolymorpha pittospori]
MNQKSDQPVFRISGAPRSLKADVRSREVRYLISMGVRTACFIGAFVTHGILRWLLIVAAFLLPYIAVVIANAGRERRNSAPPAFLPDHAGELPPAPNHARPPQNNAGTG